MLKSLELFGFKSFADKTIFEFSAGITGVVGPNGSGKSNVVDSIKWILGDQSAKSLRGKEMTDVIFNGSASRTGAQFAEATLVFDNRSRFLPLELDEVSVGRRLWQTGDSEYLVNRNSARLKDVRDLFVGTGAGAAAYCIIEQGRVDQILQSNAANRRLIFEEAAGISRFKSRRTEALRRLERVEQNLLRLTDIVDEVDSQVSNIRSQAQRAARFREVSTELEQLWVGLAADDFRRESVQRTTLQQQLQVSTSELETLREKQVAAEQQLAAADAALAEVDDELREVERTRAEQRSRIASLESTIRHLVAREHELTSDVQRLLRQQTLMNNRVSEAEAEEVHMQQVLLHEQTSFEKKKASLISGDDQLQVLQTAVAASRTHIDSTRQQLLQQMRDSSDAASVVGSYRNEANNAQRRHAEFQLQLGQLNELVNQLSAELIETQQLVREAIHEHETSENVADDLLRSREQLLSEQNVSQQSLAELREQRSALIARRTVLEDLEDKQEGFGIGVREILRRAEEADSEPWNLICGSIADLLDVDMDNAALLEVALSGRAQLLVVRKLQPFVEYLNSGRGRITGRVGFISLEDASPTGVSGKTTESGEKRGKGTIRPAEIVGADDDFSSSWWSRPERSKSDSESDFLHEPFASLAFPDSLQVTWIDQRTDSPVIRSVFSQPSDRSPLLFGRPGIVGRADGLARSPRHLPNLAADILADTWVVETLSDALRMHEETAGGCRFITLQGELVDSDGTLYAGTVRGESAVLSRKSELRRLRNELHRVEHEIAQRELRLRNLGGTIQTTDEELVSARQLVNERARKLRSVEAVLQEKQRILNDRNAAIDRLREQVSSIENELLTLNLHIDEAEVAHSAGERRLQQLQEQIAELEQQLLTRQMELEALERDRTSANMELSRSEERLLGLQESLERVREDLHQRKLQQQEAERRLHVAVDRQRDLTLARLNSGGEMAELFIAEEQLSLEVHSRSQARNSLRIRRNEATKAESQIREICRNQESRNHELQLQIRGIDHQLQTMAERIRDEFQMDVKDAVAEGRSAVAVWLSRQDSAESEDAETDSETPAGSARKQTAAGEVRAAATLNSDAQKILDNPAAYAELRTEVERRVDRLRRQLKKIGHVSTESLDNLNDLETRFGRLHAQLKDLEAARDTLRDIVRKINLESRRMFLESFETIRGHFRDLFRRLFGGGEGDLILEDPEDVLECAIDVVARPPGKELRSISLLSGGEKTMTAVALLLSIFKSRPSPFCILDEVDAALDDANIGRFVNVLRDFQQSTQFIMITHRKPTMAVTDVLYGVTMEESGISRRLSLRFEDVDERGNFNPKNVRGAKAA
ncbi:MAG: AAA family ATPase [Planctomyces sp.]|nr:AAA family ATPase [Planctomyces sp.]